MTSLIELEVEVDYIFEQGRPGKFNGPSEDWLPPEPPAARIISVKFQDSEILSSLSMKQIEQLEAQAVREETEPREF